MGQKSPLLPEICFFGLPLVCNRFLPKVRQEKLLGIWSDLVGCMLPRSLSASHIHPAESVWPLARLRRRATNPAKAMIRSVATPGSGIGAMVNDWKQLGLYVVTKHPRSVNASTTHRRTNAVSGWPNPRKSRNHHSDSKSGWRWQKPSRQSIQRRRRGPPEITNLAHGVGMAVQGQVDGNKGLNVRVNISRRPNDGAADRIGRRRI